MHTRRIPIDPANIDRAVIKEAAALIRAGELVAFPTETVYGLGADALNASAASKIYAAKGRPSDNPLIVHISRFEDLCAVASGEAARAGRLAEVFWPGPLTVIVPGSDKVPRETTGGLKTVAVRMPGHPVALALIEESGCLIAAPSANTSGRPSPTEAAHVAADMDGRIPLILDGGAVGIGIESTILDLTEEIPLILRPGYITKEMLEEALREEVRMDPGLCAVRDKKTTYSEYCDGSPHVSAARGAGTGLRPKAPGMRYRHYAPRAELIVLEGEPGRVAEEINRLVRSRQAEGKRVGVIAADETRSCYRADVVAGAGARAQEEVIARRLYGILREFDDLNVDVIYSESFDTPRMGLAIMNRLLKAAGHRVVHV